MPAASGLPQSNDGAASSDAANPAASSSASPAAPLGKLRAIARAVAAGAATGERSVVFVNHPRLVQAAVKAIVSETAPDGRPLKALGGTTTSKRETLEAAKEALAKPLDEGGVDALVITLRAGAVGHNLTCASRVVFASPCLDTSVRKQAVGRCHRMGQVRPVVVTTLALAGTVEEAALDVMHRDDLPPRFAPNGTELRDQESLRLAALEDAALGPRQ